MFVIMFAYSNCEQEKDISIDFPFEGEKIVVYCLLSNISPPTIDVYSTYALQDNSVSNRLDNVTASLTNSNGLFCEFNFSDNQGQCNIFTSPEEKYSLQAASDEMEIYTNDIEFPPEIRIDSISILKTIDESRFYLKIFFNNELSNYYYGYSIIKLSDGDIVEIVEPNFRNLLPCQEENDYNYIITGEENNFVFVVDENGELDRIANVDQIIIKLYTVTHQVYEFHESIKNSGGELGNEYSEQNPIITNIIGGYGYFASMYIDSLSVSL